ncbi:MAG: hypothetical protein WBA41_26195 [Rivularia sp. (in: cyanobacteria)]
MTKPLAANSAESIGIVTQKPVLGSTYFSSAFLPDAPRLIRFSASISEP